MKLSNYLKLTPAPAGGEEGKWNAVSAMTVRKQGQKNETRFIRMCRLPISGQMIGNKAVRNRVAGRDMSETVSVNTDVPR